MGESAPVPGSVPSSRRAAWDQYIRRAAAGDAGGLSSLYDESSSLVYAVVLRILGNEADAEEVTLDVYTQVWTQSGTFQANRGSVHAWLVMLARSRAIDRLRSAHRIRKQDTSDALFEVACPKSGPEQLSAETEKGERVRKALAILNPAQREAIEMAFYGGYTQTEMAERLGQPLGTVKTRIRLGLLKLKEHLGDLPFA